MSTPRSKLEYTEKFSTINLLERQKQSASDSYKRRLSQNMDANRNPNTIEEDLTITKDNKANTKQNLLNTDLDQTTIVKFVYNALSRDRKI